MSEKQNGATIEYAISMSEMGDETRGGENEEY